MLIPALPEFKRRNPGLTLRIEATHQYADFNASRVDVAIRYGREHSDGTEIRAAGRGEGSAGLRARAGQGRTEDAAKICRGEVLIHLTTQPRAWPVWLKEAGLSHLTPRGHLWLDSVPAMLEAAEQGLGVTLGMSPLIKARPGFGKKLVAPFAFEATHSETIYLVSRTEQARDRRIAAVRRWIVEAVGARANKRATTARRSAPAARSAAG